MNKEEILKDDLEKTKIVDQWWTQLHLQDKKIIYEAFVKIIKQKYCTHPHLSTNKFYGDMIRQCPDCDLILYEDQILKREVMEWQTNQNLRRVSETNAEDFEGGGD